MCICRIDVKMKNCVQTICVRIIVYLAMHNSVHACSNQHMPENFRCYVNFIDFLSCTWYSNSHAGDGPFSLHLNTKNKQCLLLKISHNKFSCNITGLMADETEFYNLSVQDNTTNRILDEIETFAQSCHIKLDPPVNASYKINNSTYVIMWKGYEEYLGSPNLKCESQLKKHTSSWKNSKKKIFTDKNADNQSEELLASEFEMDSDYDLRLRCKTQENSFYESQWRTKEENKVNIIHIIMVVCSLATACILLYLVFCSSLCGRFKISYLEEVPTAASFFKPMYLVHNGNFQDWTKYPNKCVQGKQKVRSCSPMDSVTHIYTTACFQNEMISPIIIEAPTSIKEHPVTEEAFDSISWSGLLQNKEISLNEIYPSFSPDFSMFNEEEEQDMSDVDCPTVYFSYNGTYVVNSVETEDE
ncbi:interleukin-21 receptor-like isoform X2 [Pyxicephalus adspersus]|uniref:interleukin-21 receptor-like isoform X2 n=1 Tax=Pyxicephalus adspersus TaxID=30357 RepID=UPI003B596237